MSEAAIDRLAELLGADEPVLLGAAERELVRGALTALASAERRVGHLVRVAGARGVALEEIEAAGVAAAGALGESDVAVRYDFAAADAARGELESALAGARSASAVVGAALRFARDAAVLAGSRPG